MRLESFEAGELHQILNIRRGKPVLLRARDLHPSPLGKSDQRLPEMVIGRYQQTSVPPAKRPQIAQRLKHINRVADIVEEDVIEFLLRTENLPKLLLVRERDCEFERWISLLRDIHYLGADVDAFAVAWPDGSQEDGRCRSEPKHLLLRLYQESEQTG